MNLDDMTDDDLENLRQDVVAEQHRREVLSRIPAQVQQLNEEFLGKSGVTPGAPWRQPTGAHDAYPLDWQVTHGGKTWASLTPANVWEPGVSGWREVVTEPAVPQWVAPTGAHDAYDTGDQVLFDGQVWQSVIDTNTWSPTEYPAGWALVDEPTA